MKKLWHWLLVVVILLWTLCYKTNLKRWHPARCGIVSCEPPV